MTVITVMVSADDHGDSDDNDHDNYDGNGYDSGDNVDNKKIKIFNFFFV